MAEAIDAVLLALRHERVLLDDAIRAIEAVRDARLERAEATPTIEADTATAMRIQRNQHLTVRAMVRALLEDGREWTYGELNQQYRIMFPNNIKGGVSVTLSNMLQAGEIVRVRPKVYRKA